MATEALLGETRQEGRVSKSEEPASLSNGSVSLDLAENVAWRVLAEFAIHSVDKAHMSVDDAKVIEILEDMSLEYRLGPIETGIEGRLDQVLDVIQSCHEAIIESHGRVLTSITIEDRRDKVHLLDDMVTSVEHHLGWKAR